MAQSLIFYTNPMSRGRMVRWMLEEVGAPYETRIVEYGAAMKEAGYLSLNPMGKIPVLKDGEVVVTETAAIIAYLADRFPAAGLAPATSDAMRGVYYRWLFFGAGPFEAAVTNAALKVEVPEDRRGFVGYGCLDDVLNTLEAAVTTGPFLLGETFSAADVYLGSQIGFGLAFGSIEKRPAFSAYWDRIKDRPAAVRARAIDNAMLPEDRRI